MGITYGIPIDKARDIYMYTPQQLVETISALEPNRQHDKEKKHS